MTSPSNRDRRILAILGSYEIAVGEAMKLFFEYLKDNLALPCEVTGVEDFRWEEPYVLGGWSWEKHEQLRKSQPSYEDRFELLAIELGPCSEWMMFGPGDIAACVRRIADKKEFLLGLAELKVKPRKSKNGQLIDDYGYWFVNSR